LAGVTILKKKKRMRWRMKKEKRLPETGASA